MGLTTIATDVRWTSNNPPIYFDFSYEKKREGSTQYYSITVDCNPVTGDRFFGYPIYLEIYLDGSCLTGFTLKNASPSRWSSSIIATTGWLSVNNKTSGTTALSIRLYSGLGSDRDATYNYSLAIDPAASTISCTPANIESKPTITISRASSNFTHTVTYKFGSLTGTIATKTTATSITSWTIPADFYAQIPNAKTGEGTLTCTTYSGNTQIGSPTTCKLSVTTDETKCKPTVSGTVVDKNAKTIAVTGSSNVLVKFCSTALCTMNVALNKNAGSIKAKTINNTAIDGNTLEIPNVETGTFDFYAKDSREYFNTDKVTDPEVTLIPYIQLTSNVTAQRTDPTSGATTLSISGNYFNGNFGKEDNSLYITYNYGLGDVEVEPVIKGNTYSVKVELSLDYRQAFTIEVMVKDRLNTVVKTVNVGKGIPVFDWGEDDFSFNVPVTINGVNILEKLAELERLVKG